MDITKIDKDWIVKIKSITLQSVFSKSVPKVFGGCSCQCYWITKAGDCSIYGNLQNQNGRHRDCILELPVITLKACERDCPDIGYTYDRQAAKCLNCGVVELSDIDVYTEIKHERLFLRKALCPIKD